MSILKQGHVIVFPSSSYNKITLYPPCLFIEYRLPFFSFHHSPLISSQYFASFPYKIPQNWHLSSIYIPFISFAYQYSIPYEKARRDEKRDEFNFSVNTTNRVPGADTKINEIIPSWKIIGKPCRQ